MRDKVTLEDIFGSGNAKRQLERLEAELPDIRDTLWKIYQKHQSNCDTGNENREMKLEKYESDIAGMFNCRKYIYHVSSRIKAPEKLVKKIVDRLYQRRRHYIHINEENYHKIVTDLIGIKLIHRFPDEWVSINELIYQLFYKGDESFVNSYEQDYRDDLDEAFLIEKPVVYYLPGEDLSIYLRAEEQMGRALFQYVPKTNYHSVHYLINYRGNYMEIQVRTLSDELWSEVEHDLVYKQEITALKDKLSEAAELLRSVLRAVDEISMYMKKQIDLEETEAEKYWGRGRKQLKEAVEIMTKKGEEDHGKQM